MNFRWGWPKAERGGVPEDGAATLSPPAGFGERCEPQHGSGQRPDCP